MISSKMQLCTGAVDNEPTSGYLAWMMRNLALVACLILVALAGTFGLPVAESRLLSRDNSERSPPTEGENEAEAEAEKLVAIGAEITDGALTLRLVSGDPTASSMSIRARVFSSDGQSLVRTVLPIGRDGLASAVIGAADFDPPLQNFGEGLLIANAAGLGESGILASADVEMSVRLSSGRFEALESPPEAIVFVTETAPVADVEEGEL